jgi:biopolymer transport protein ExbD
VTLSGFRRRLRQIRLRGEEAGEEGGELNLVPYLDMVTNVMLFLLATVTFSTALGDLHAAAPAHGPGRDERPTLTVSVSPAGFTVAAPDRVEPLLPGRDYAALAARVAEARRTLPSARLVLNADAKIPYDEIVSTIDAVRNGSDDEILLSAGVE